MKALKYLWGVVALIIFVVLAYIVGATLWKLWEYSWSLGLVASVILALGILFTWKDLLTKYSSKEN